MTDLAPTTPTDRYQPASTSLSADATDIITAPPVEVPPTPANPEEAPRPPQ